MLALGAMNSYLVSIMSWTENFTFSCFKSLLDTQHLRDRTRLDLSGVSNIFECVWMKYNVFMFINVWVGISLCWYF